MIPGALTKLKINDIPLGAIRTGHITCSVDLPDWNITKGKQYTVHSDDQEGPFIYSNVSSDRIDLWTLDDKLKYFTWIR